MLTNITFRNPRLHRDFFKPNNTWIKCLELQNINLDIIHGYAFGNLLNLETLEMHNIQLNTSYNISNNIFAKLDKLTTLILDNVKMIEFPENVLSPLQSLKLLILENIVDDKMINIDNLFGSDNLTNLKEVFIRNCNLGGTIKKSTFSGLKNVINLEISTSQITHIEAESFDMVLQTLQLLSLHGNNLTTLPNEIFKNHQKIIHIHLANNPWKCNCNIEHLRKFMKTSMNVKFDMIYCEWANSTKQMLNTISNLCSHSVVSAMCSLEKNVSLSIPNSNILTALKIQNGKLSIETPFIESNHRVVGFEITNNVRGSLYCFFSNQSDAINVEKQLKSRQMYRFCLIGTSPNTVVPLDCISFYSNDGDEGRPWILEKDKHKIITPCILIAILGTITGILSSFVLAKLYPMLILTQNFKCEKSY